MAELGGALRRYLLLAASAWALSICAAAPGAAPAGAKPNFDARQNDPALREALARDSLSAAELQARDAAFEALRDETPGLSVSWHSAFETPKFVRSTSSLLPLDIAPGGWRAGLAGLVERYGALFAISSAALDQCRVSRDFVTKHNGVRHVTLQQQIDGVDLIGAQLSASFGASGQLINFCSTLLPIQTAEGAHALSEADALKAAARDAEVEWDTLAGRSAADEKSPEGAAKAAAVRAWLPVSRKQARPVWAALVPDSDSANVYEILVDGETGAVLRRYNMTQYAAEPASYRVFADADFVPLDSPAPWSPGPDSPSSAQAPTVARRLVSLAAYDGTASPLGWIDTGSTVTRGNNVFAHSDKNNDNAPDLPLTAAADRVFDFAMDLGQSPLDYADAAIVQLFYTANFYHDRLYQLGFDEAAGNYQQDNFGRGGAEGDAVWAQALDGALVGNANNANFLPTYDGAPGRMQMYVWNGPNPDREGSLDAQIVVHELTHGLSWRLHLPQGGLGSMQSDGMGEGWSDFFSLALLACEDDALDGVYPTGPYVTYLASTGFTSNYYFGIRRYPYSANLQRNPLTLNDIDPSQIDLPLPSEVPFSPRFSYPPTNANQVHRLGEIWCSALWECRTALIRKHGFAGNDLAMRLVVDGMKLSPGDPTFLEARDAILQADLAASQGENLCELWTAFAKRGFGAAASVPSNTATTSGAVQDFSLPFEACASRRGAVAFGANAYRCGQTILALAKDLDLAGAQFAAVVLATPAGDVETVPLRETIVGRGVFAGIIPAAAGTPIPEDGILQTLPGTDMAILATYEDADGGGGAPLTAQASARLDCAPPVIEDISLIGASATGIALSVRLSEPASVLARAGMGCKSFAAEFASEALAAEHTLILTGFENCQKIFFEVEASDALGNRTLDDNGGACHVARTLQLDPQKTLLDDFESGAPLPGWSHFADVGPDNWAIRDRDGAKAFAYRALGYNSYIDTRLVSPPIAGAAQLVFTHRYSVETGYDGGVLELTTDGGQSWLDLGMAIMEGGYSMRLSSTFGNPLGGRMAWSGDSGVAWLSTRVDLGAFAGEKRVSWRFGADESYPSNFWDIDAVWLLETRACAPASAGAIRLDRASYSCGQVLAVDVSDGNAPGNAIHVSIQTAADSETIALTDDDGDKVYQGFLPIAEAGSPVSPEDGALQGARQDTIVALYADADQGDGQPGTAMDQAALDCRDCLADPVADGGFEQGAAGPWEQLSTNFGTPLCTFSTCGTGSGTAGPRSGAWWAWFGGINAFERGVLEQPVVIQGENATLSYWLWIGVANGTTSDTLRVWIDDTLLAEYGKKDAAAFPAYRLVEHDISAFASLTPRSLRFESLCYFNPSGGSSTFNLDDIAIAPYCPDTIASIADCALREGSGGGTKTFEIPISLSSPWAGPGPVEFHYALEPLTADAADFVGPANGIAILQPGEAQAFAQIHVAADSLPEVDETALLRIERASPGVGVDRTSAIVTILNDDYPQQAAFGQIADTGLYAAIDLAQGRAFPIGANPDMHLAGDFAGGDLARFHAWRAPARAIDSIDAATGARQSRLSARGLPSPAHLAVGAAWDASRGRMALLCIDAARWDDFSLGEIDLTSGEYAERANYPIAGLVPLNLAIDETGAMFCVARGAAGGPNPLLRLDPATGEATRVGDLDTSPTGLRFPMDFDPLTGELFAAWTNGHASRLIRIDPNTGATADIGPLGDGKASFANFAVAKAAAGGAPKAAVIPSAIDFGPVDIDDGPARAYVDVRNTGAVPLQWGVPAMELIGGGAIRIATPAPTEPVAVGGSYRFEIQFDPASEGEANAELRLRTADASQPIALVPIRGLGVQLEGPPIITGVAGAVDGSANVQWANPNPPAAAVVAMAYDIFEDDFVAFDGPGGPLPYRALAASATSATLPLAFSGAYHLWIGNLYASSNWQPSAPWTGILYGGVPHPNLAPQAESLGEGDVRLAWTPDPYGVWHYQILVFRGGTGYIEPPDGPSAGFGFGLWTFIDYGAAAYAPAKASFADGWARFRLETPGEYWLAIRAVGWLPPYPATDFEQTHIALP